MQIVPFRQILELNQFTTEMEEAADKNAHSKYKFGFVVKTTQRVFTLFAKTEEERRMWIAGLQYVIVSTAKVQDIMLENDKNLNSKMTDHAKQIRREASKEIFKSRSTKRLLDQ